MKLTKIAFLSVTMMLPAVNAQVITIAAATDARTERSFGGTDNSDNLLFDQIFKTFRLFVDRAGDVRFNDAGVFTTNTGNTNVRGIDIVNSVTFSNRFRALRGDLESEDVDVIQVFAPFGRGGGRAQSAGRGVSVIRGVFLGRNGPLPQRSIGSIFRATSAGGFCLSRRDNRRTIMRSQQSCPGRSIVISELSTPSRRVGGRVIGSRNNNNAATAGRNGGRVSRIR